MEAAERMKAMRERRRARGVRELRLVVPDAALRRFDDGWLERSQPGTQSRERDALKWIEAVAEFDDQ